MDIKYDGGPAFPHDDYDEYDGLKRIGQTDGMSLRDYFAGQVIAAVFAAGSHLTVDGLAQQAYAIADAMLKER